MDKKKALTGALILQLLSGCSFNFIPTITLNLLKEYKPMPCYHPLKGYKTRKNGQNLFTLKSADAANDSDLSEIACGQCIGCKIQRSKDWAIRCANEMHYSEHNSFLTLTYSPENLPPNGTLVKKHLTQFFKSYRQYLQRNQNTKIRYYACGEYGEKLSRPHYHALIFGHQFQEDKYPWKKINGNQYYRSPQLEKLWPHGTSLIGNANIATACYIAKYITKKINGEQTVDHYGTLNKETGEIEMMQSEYTCMSTSPGIGARWLDEFQEDLAKGFITHDGIKFRIPRYYMDRLGKNDPGLQQEIKENTALIMAEKEQDTYERLMQREKFTHKIMEEELRNLEKS